MRKLIFTILLILFCSFNIFAQSRITNEEYIIYSLVLKKINKEFFVIKEKIPSVDFREMEEESDEELNAAYNNLFPKEAKNALDDLYAKSLKEYKLERKLSTTIKYIFVNDEDIQRAFGKTKDEYQKWQNFYKNYPGSKEVLTLTKVGFDSSRNKAIVFVGTSCGNVCGSLDYYFLEKLKNKWVVVKWKTILVS